MRRWTIIEWLDAIEDEGIKGEAVYYTVKDENEHKSCGCVSEAIISGFNWDYTRQGDRFWGRIYEEQFKVDSKNAINKLRGKK